MNLITNISNIFSDTIGNLQRIEERFKDINDSLNKAINAHIAQPNLNKFIVSTGFGEKWKNSYSKQGLPTSILISNADWLDSLLSPILCDAIAAQINACSILMLATTPVVAQACAPLVASILALFPGGALIATTMTTGISTATASGALNGIPALVSTALVGLSSIIISQRLNSSTVDLANGLDFDLESVGLIGATNARASSWSSVNSQILSIPINPQLLGSSGLNFWTAILLTIQQAIPGIPST